MRPIVWGFILMVVGGIFWVMFSFVGAIGQIGTGQVSPGMMTLVSLFGMLFFFSLPVTVVMELVGWIRRRRLRQAAVKVEAPIGSALPLKKPKYCMDCGVELQSVGETGKSFCPKCNKVS